MIPRRRIIVLTPIRNESWILDNFIKSVLLWADCLVVSDQLSTDGSAEILSRYPEVVVLRNDSQEYNEAENRRNLLSAAREIGEGNIILSLDADERLSANILSPNQLEALQALTPGTGIQINFANVLPGGVEYWEVPLAPIGFVDDGREPDTEAPIHFPRTCFNKFETVKNLEELKLMHLQYLDPARTASKHRWYQMWEWINTPKISPIELFRKYHHMESIPNKIIRRIPNMWTDGYYQAGIDVFDFVRDGSFWWDVEVSKWLENFPAGYFDQVAIDCPDYYELPRTQHRGARMMKYLKFTQPFYVTLRPSLTFVALYLLDGALGLFWKRKVSL